MWWKIIPRVAKRAHEELLLEIYLRVRVQARRARLTSYWFIWYNLFIINRYVFIITEQIDRQTVRHTRTHDVGIKETCQYYLHNRIFSLFLARVISLLFLSFALNFVRFLAQN